MDKYEIAQILREIGTILELIDPNPKKGIAYRKAAHTIESMGDLPQIVEEKALETFPGIGKGISEMVTTLVQKGSLNYHTRLKEKVPQGLLELTTIPGLGLKKLRILYEEFKITNLSELEAVLKDENIQNIKGFGPAFIKKALKQIASVKAHGHSLLYPQAVNIAHAILDILTPWVNKIEFTGTLRRKCEVIHQIDLLAFSKNPELCLSHFVQHGLTKQILTHDEKHASVLLKQGNKANLHLVTEKEYAFALLKTTGGSKHLNELENEAIKQNYRLTDHSFEKMNAFVKKIEILEENDIYKTLGLPYIPPEVREGYGEVEAAKKGNQFHLIEENDLRGTFHCHTLDSDGQNTLEELVQGAKQLGWEYIGIADHSKASYQANGMSEERMLNQLKNIREINKKIGSDFKIFSGVECDILKDGNLDFSEEILKQLDYVIVSIHRYFNMEEEEMTNRLLKAIENPYTTMIGHLTGRLLRHRDPYKLNIPKILDACVANRKIIELNAYPSRLDMDWRYWIKAKEMGIKCSINPDAHSLKDLMNCHYGINMARKGWLEKDDVINTLPLKEMKAFLKKNHF